MSSHIFLSNTNATLLFNQPEIERGNICRHTFRVLEDLCAMFSALLSSIDLSFEVLFPVTYQFLKILYRKRKRMTLTTLQLNLMANPMKIILHTKKAMATPTQLHLTSRQEGTRTQEWLTFHPPPCSHLYSSSWLLISVAQPSDSNSPTAFSLHDFTLCCTHNFSPLC